MTTEITPKDMKQIGDMLNMYLPKGHKFTLLITKSDGDLGECLAMSNTVAAKVLPALKAVTFALEKGAPIFKS